MANGASTMRLDMGVHIHLSDARQCRRASMSETYHPLRLDKGQYASERTTRHVVFDPFRHFGWSSRQWKRELRSDPF